MGGRNGARPWPGHGGRRRRRACRGDAASCSTRSADSRRRCCGQAALTPCWDSRLLPEGCEHLIGFACPSPQQGALADRELLPTPAVLSSLAGSRQPRCSQYAARVRAINPQLGLPGTFPCASAGRSAQPSLCRFVVVRDSRAGPRGRPATRGRWRCRGMPGEAAVRREVEPAFRKRWGKGLCRAGAGRGCEFPFLWEVGCHHPSIWGCYDGRRMPNIFLPYPLPSVEILP